MDDPSDRIAAAVLAHLARYPGARDTADGVRDWWLPVDLRGTPVEEVEAVLRRLAEAGRLGIVPCSDGRVQFGGAPPAGADETGPTGGR